MRDYQPALLAKLHKGYDRLHRYLELDGYSVWYDSAIGEDIKLAKMILDGELLEVMVTYIRSNYELEEA